MVRHKRYETDLKISLYTKELIWKRGFTWFCACSQTDQFSLHVLTLIQKLHQFQMKFSKVSVFRRHRQKFRLANDAQLFEV